MSTNRQRVRTPRGGFSLLELLIVLAIIGIIAAMVVPNLLGVQEGANIDATKGSIHNLETTLELYAGQHNNGKLPLSSEGGIELLLNPPVDRNNQPVRPYLDKFPTDAWGNPLQYTYPSSNHPENVAPFKADIYSFGPDEQDDNGGNDDINNWTIEDEDL